MKLSKVGLGALLVFVPCAACSQVLDLEDARVDPTIDAGSGGVAGNNGGSQSTATTSNHQHSQAGDSPADVTPARGGSESAASGGTAGNGTASLAGAGDKGGDDLPVASLCERYCDTVTTNCKGKYEQYRTFDQCVEVCKRMPAGSPGDENVDSVECRLRQAEFSSSEPFVYCKSSGPLGAGKCGSNCVTYCGLMQATCTPETTAGNLEPSYYDSTQDCLNACGALPTNTDDPTQYSSSATAVPSCFVGNNVYCRAYHLAAALEQDAPDEHCPHARGADPCIEQ